MFGTVLTGFEACMAEIISRYEAILDGRDPHDAKAIPIGIVIKGP